MADSNTATINRDQFKRLADSLLKEVPAILKQRDTSDKAMDKKSALLKALLMRLQDKLGISDAKKELGTKGFQTYEFAYRQALYELLSEKAKEPSL